VALGSHDYVYLQEGRLNPSVLKRFLRKKIPQGWSSFFHGYGGIEVFCYHGVVEQKSDHRLERNFCLLSEFRSHLQLLLRLRILTLAELGEKLEPYAGAGQSAAIITFDDGYANNLLAAEVLAAARAPWSIFVSTGALGPGNSLWTAELSLLLLHGQAERIQVFERDWLLNQRQFREDAFQSIRHRLKSLAAEARQETMNFLRSQFPQGETQRLLHQFPSLQMLTWENLSQLAGTGVEIGSHGVHHEIHHPDQPEAIRRFELTESKAILEQRLERPCRFFAYPNGGFNPASAAEVDEAGYELAFTTEPGVVAPGANPYLLPRLTFQAKI
jgi:peptidoglycan/xylan/chitin deacetylase (PgdA/CDA1 family)